MCFEVARGGRSGVTITLKSDAGKVERFAAEELQKYLEKITGARLPLVTGVEKGRSRIQIRVIENPSLPRVPIPKNEDSFKIIIRSTQIDLIGQTPRAVLYAVYAFLEESGCRWFAPEFSFYKEFGNEMIPEINTLLLEPKTISSSPSFLYRKKHVEEGLSHNLENLKQFIDWLPKNRINIFNCPLDYQHSGRIKWDNWREDLIPELEKRGLLIEVGGHGYENYLRPEEFYRDHPEWFGTIDGHYSDRPNVVFNTANPEAMDKLAEEIISYLRAHPEIRIFDLWPPDGARWGDNPACLAQGGAPERNAIVVRHVRNAIRKAGLPVMVETIAYHAALDCPERVDLPDDIMVDFCPITRSYEYAVDDPNHPENRRHHRAILQWKKRYQGIFNIYTYYRRYAWLSKPVVLVNLLPYEARYYHRQGVKGMSSYAEPGDWYTYEYQHYLFGKLLWDVKLDEDALLEDYCAKRFGLAGRLLADYFETMEPVVTHCWTLHHTNPGGKSELKQLESGVKKARKLLTKAMDQLQSDPQKLAAVQRLEISLQYVERDVELCRLALEKRKDRFRERLEDLIEFMKANTEHGMIIFIARREQWVKNFYRDYVLRESQ